MNRLVYIPVIVYGRDKYEYNAISCGCFLTEKSAINGIIEKLVENEFVSFDFFLDWLSDRKFEIAERKRECDEDEYNEDEYNEDDKIISNIDEKNITKEQFINYLKQKVNCDVNLLISMCKEHGDSYYKDGWNFQIDEHYLIG